MTECAHCGFSALDVIESGVARHVCFKACWDYLFEFRRHPVVWQNELIQLQQEWP